MKIISKVAVEPDSLNSWESFRYVMEKLGFSKGLVLAKVPKRWPRLLLDALDVGDIERQKIVTRLQKYKDDRMVTTGMRYQADLAWIDNILNNRDFTDIEKVLVKELPTIQPSDVQISTPSLADEEFFDAPRDVSIPNSPEELADAADILLKNSSRVIFVDPYFKLHRTSIHLKTLAEFARLANDGGKCSELIIYTLAEHVPSLGCNEIERAFNKAIRPNVRAGFRIIVKYIDVGMSKYPMHARYLITEKGSLRYDKGFQPGDPPVHVDISIIDVKKHAENHERFIDAINDYKIELECTWNN